MIERWRNPNAMAGLAPIEFATGFGVANISRAVLVRLLEAAGYVPDTDVAHDAFDIDAYEADGLKVEDA
jgi:hypothetical protein